MKIKVRKEFTLILEHEEAEWLRRKMQNPFGGAHPADEDLEEADMRGRFWKALQVLDEDDF